MNAEMAVDNSTMKISIRNTENYTHTHTHTNTDRHTCREAEEASK